MATFITNIKFSQQGIKDIDHTTKRAAIFKAEAKKLGVKVKDIYWTLGDHDGLLILEAPDDETATAAILHLGAMGNVHTTTCRAFTAAEMIRSLPRCMAAEFGSFLLGVHHETFICRVVRCRSLSHGNYDDCLRRRCQG